MNRTEMLQIVEENLQEKDYQYIRLTSSVCDFFAKRENSIILKVLENIDSLNSLVAEELKKMSSFFQASPQIIGDHSHTNRLEDDIITFRHQIPVFSLSTFRRTIKGGKVFIFQSNGRYFVNINAEKFRRSLNENNFSKNNLAKRTGISTSTLQRCEKGNSTSLETALRLEEFLGDIVREISFEKINYPDLSQGNSEISKKMIQIELNPTDFRKILTTGASDFEKNEKFLIKEEKIPKIKTINLMEKIKELTNSYSFLLLENDSNINFPYLRKDEFMKIKDKDELREIVE